MIDRDFRFKSVAIVDDEQGRLDVLTRYVEEAGYIAIPAQGGRKALELFHNIRPEVAVIYGGMESDVTAFDLCSLINSPLKRDHRVVPIIVISHEEMEWMTSGEPKLVNDYLTLPFPAYQLIQTIRRLLKLQDIAQSDTLWPTELVS